MAVNSAQYLVTREIAQRTGELQNHYRTADGRFILDSRAMSLIRLTPDEYVTGIEGVERITEEQAMTLIAKGGYMLGDTEAETVEDTQENVNDNVKEEVEE